MSHVTINVSNQSKIMKTSLEYIPFVVVFVTIHIVIAYELFIILPLIDQHRTIIFYTHAAFGTLLYFDIMGSAYYLVITNTSITLNNSPAILNKGWTYCYACEDNAPPRSKHCYHCNICILRRDHHCSFLSKCVGYHNHRYYISLLLNISIGSWYCNYLNIDYAVEVLGRHSAYDLLSLFLPFLSWLFGLLPGYTFAVMCVSIVCLMSALFTTFYLVYAVRNMAAGRLQDSRRGEVYDRGSALLNVREVFGTRAALAIICPFVESPLPGDGVAFAGDPKETPKNL